MPMINYTNEKFEVGQTVALRYQGNKARYNSKGDNGYELATIEKIGRKYLTLKGGLQINLESGYEKTNLSANYQMFPSEEGLLEQIQREKNIDKIRSLFRGFGDVEISNTKLDEIIKIIESE